MEGTIGEIRLFASNFAPRNWWYCDGTLIAIRSNTALFAILGTTYGGDGKVTFALPDLRGRSAIGAGQGNGLSYYDLGQMGGTHTTVLTSLNLPMHTHTATANVVVPAYADGGDKNTPTNNHLAGLTGMYTSDPTDSFLKQNNVNLATTVTGGTSPLNFSQPYLGMNYIICMTGVFPARN